MKWSELKQDDKYRKCIWGSWGCLLQDYDVSVIIMEMYIVTYWHNFKGHGKKKYIRKKNCTYHNSKQDSNCTSIRSHHEQAKQNS